MEVTPQANELERRIDLSVAIEAIDQALDQRLRRLSRNVKMPGFRPGKVPLSLVRQQYGPGVHEEVLSEALDHAFGEAVKAQELRVAGHPRVEPKKTESTTHLEFSAIFEVYPDFALGDLSAAQIERPLLEVSAAEVDKTLEILRKQRVTYEKTERPAASGDRVTVNFVCKREGQPIPKGEEKDFAFILGRSGILPGFDQAVEGLKPGESKSFDLTFPEDYAGNPPGLAGKEAQVDLTLNSVSVPRLPEIDADFARGMGIADGDVEVMRAEVESNLRREVKHRLEQRVKDQVIGALLTAHPIAVPRSLIEMETERLTRLAREDAKRSGVPDLRILPEWFAGQAQRRVTLGLIFEVLIRTAQIKAEPEQVRALIEENAQSYEFPEEVVRWHYSQPERLAEIESLVLEKNAVDWVLARAQVTDKALPFDELMGLRA